MRELPEGAERRLVLQLLSYWRDLLKDEQDCRLFPSFADLDPSAIYDIWPHCFALDLFGHESGPVFRAVGEKFNGFYSGKLANLPVSDLTPGTLTALSSHYFSEVIEKNAPISRGGTIDNPDGPTYYIPPFCSPCPTTGKQFPDFSGPPIAVRRPTKRGKRLIS